ncbi:hypothetical protein CA608_12585 [Caulobacter vibrioides]|uniref:hypothetical protein n=1 Tax=Caulobacter vibrioides TaxID=155892 RepID=UPI000BB4CE8D|nr:hypothetical protein [Caulobacter vibrioides]ATC25310.1 hypothetical protein CA608_12585 [Caulobacter vibrioides]
MGKSAGWMVGLLLSGWVAAASAQDASQSPEPTIEQKMTGAKIDEITAKLGAPQGLKELGSFQFATYEALICQGSGCSHSANCWYEFKIDKPTATVVELKVNGRVFGPSMREHQRIGAMIMPICRTYLEGKLAG